MQYQKESSIICLGDTKQAALYFDRIFPVSFVIRELYHHPRFQSFFNKVLSDGVIDRETLEIPKSEIEKLIKEISTDDSALNLLSIYENLLGSDERKVNPEFINKSFELIISPLKLIFLNTSWFIS